MRIDRLCEAVSLPRWIERCLAGNLRLNCLSLLAALCLVAPQSARPQDTPAPEKPKVEADIIPEGLMSYGNYKIFASGYDEKLYTAGVEYDRHSWGYFLKARMDYVAEVLPFVLLNKPLCTDQWGNPCYPIAVSKQIREYVPGAAIAPIGFRLLWRDNKTIKPYLVAKGGIIAFTKKVPATQSSYENFLLESAMGVQVKMSPRCDLRLGLFSDFHFSNAFVTFSDPGLDVMNANIGLVFHFNQNAH